MNSMRNMIRLSSSHHRSRLWRVSKKTTMRSRKKVNKKKDKKKDKRKTILKKLMSLKNNMMSS